MTGFLKRFFQSHKGAFFKADTQEKENVQGTALSDFIFKEISRYFFAKDPIFAEKKRNERFSARLDAQNRCYGFFDKDGLVASYLWISAPDRPINVPWAFNIRLAVRPGGGYIWDCATAQRHRHKGLYKRGLTEAKSMLSEMGIKRAYICCAKDNLHSKAGIISAGFREIFSFSGIRVGPLCFIRKKNGRGRVIMKGNTYDIIAD